MWQEFVGRQNADRFALLSVAVDADPERVRPFATGLPFTTAVDSAGALGRRLDFDVVLNGLFLDEAGVVRHLHVGGFDVRRPEVAAEVEALIRADFAGSERPALARQEALEVEVLRAELAARPDDPELHFALGDALQREGRLDVAAAAFRRAAELSPRDWSAPFALGAVLRRQGRLADAVTCWRTALALDPANFTVRKQIWLAEHPERFGERIDFAWQKEQLAREGYRR